MQAEQVVQGLIDKEDFELSEEDSRQLRNFLRGKTVLVTGGAGSIGRELVWQLLGFEVRSIRVFDNSEYNIYQMSQRHSECRILRFIIGDVADKDKVREAMHGADIVFHAAAMKHVDIVEYNLDQAMMTNVIMAI